MSRYATRKNTAAGKAVTLERRSKRRERFTIRPLDTDALMAELSTPRAAQRRDDATAALARLQRRYGL